MQNKKDKREYICEKAYQELLVKGINKFSLNKFITELQMSKGQFYYYFKTKEELIYKTIDNKCYEVFNDRFQQTKSKSTLIEKLFTYFSFFLEESDPKFVDFNKLLKSTFHLYINTEDKEIQQLNRDFDSLIFKHIYDIFEEMIQKGYLKEEAKQFPRSLIATADGMYLHSLMDSDYDIKTYLSEYLIMIDTLLKNDHKGSE